MIPSTELIKMFFHDLKQYNPTNFRTLESGNIQSKSPEVHKAFSSVVTRYFIFVEKHPDLSEIEGRILYYKLKLDMIARYFASYPDCNPDELIAFQTELKNYVLEAKHDESSI